MKILELCHYHLPHTGGVEQYVASLSQLLRAEGHTVEIWTTYTPNSLATRTFRSLAAPMANPITPSLLPALANLPKEQRIPFDLIHTHVHYSFASLAATLTKPFHRTPLLLTCHGVSLNYSQPRRAIEHIFNVTAGHLVLNSANATIVSSPQQRAALFRLGSHKVTIIPPWVDTSEMLPCDPIAFRRKHNPSNLPTLVFVGRLLPVKGLEYLISALGIINRNTNTPLALWIIGDESPGYKGHKIYLENVVAMHRLENSIHFFGPMPHNQLADAYLSADLFISPTLGEGAGLTLLEAMSFGRCCIASNVPTPNELLTHLETGYLVPPRSPSQLASAILYLLNHPLLRIKIGLNAYSQITQHHSPVQALRSYTELFEKTIQQKRGTSQ